MMEDLLHWSCMVQASLYSRIKPWLNRWHHQLIGIYAGEDSSLRGNSPGQISSHCVVQSAVSGP